MTEDEWSDGDDWRWWWGGKCGGGGRRWSDVEVKDWVEVAAERWNGNDGDIGGEKRSHGLSASIY